MLINDHLRGAHEPNAEMVRSTETRGQKISALTARPSWKQPDDFASG